MSLHVSHDIMLETAELPKRHDQAQHHRRQSRGVQGSGPHKNLVVQSSMPQTPMKVLLKKI